MDRQNEIKIYRNRQEIEQDYENFKLYHFANCRRRQAPNPPLNLFFAAYTTYAQHGLVNIAKKKRELKSSQINLFEEIFTHEY